MINNTENQEAANQETIDRDWLLYKIEALAESLLKKRDEAVTGRASSGIERRWREDEDAFNGIDDTTRSSSMLDYATGSAYVKPNAGPKRSTVLINIIRGKCEVAEGRFSDIQLPIDDKNWALKVTPVPALVRALKDERPAVDKDGQEIQKPDQSKVTISDVAKKETEEAKEQMKLMEAEVDDQLTECDFNAENRKCVKDAVRLGTCVLKGPNIVKQIRKAWMSEGGTFSMKRVEELKPASKRVDHWNIFPDPMCDGKRNMGYIWESGTILSRDLKGLIGVPGYLENQIHKILQEEPKKTLVVENKQHQQIIQQNTLNQGAPYEIWEYHGDVNKEDLEAMGCDCEEFEDKALSACVIFVNDRPIKAQLNLIDGGDLPYDFFQWTSVPGSIWGIGIPRMMIWQQRVITAAWRAMMDNAGDSSGVNVIFGSGVEPVDGVWELTGKKMWEATGDVEDVREAFAQFQVANNQVELQNIIELALRFIDMETNLPMLFQGEKAEIPETLGATNIMVDSNNVALRCRVKTWDDQITKPHITRYYYWNMQYNEKENIKGDYSVKAVGASALLEKDQQAQSLAEVMELRADPNLQKLIDWPKAVRQLLSARKLDIVLPDEEIKKEDEKQPEDGEQQAEEQKAQSNIDAANIKVQGELEKAKMEQQADREELELKRETMREELVAKKVESELQREHDKAIKVMEYNMKVMELSEKTGMSLEKIKADLARDAAKISLQRELSTEKIAAEQVVTPVSEPAGRAPEGQAFQK